MELANNDIRGKIEENNIRYWEVAAALGITDGNFSRKLRQELSDEEKEKVFHAIDRLVESKAAVKGAVK